MFKDVLKYVVVKLANDQTPGRGYRRERLMTIWRMYQKRRATEANN